MPKKMAAAPTSARSPLPARTAWKAPKPMATANPMPIGTAMARSTTVATPSTIPPREVKRRQRSRARSSTRARSPVFTPPDSRAPSQESPGPAGRSSPTRRMKVSSRDPVARTSSSDPCAMSSPRWMIPTWVTSRSTTSRTWLVRKMVRDRRETRSCSIRRIPETATASIPSKGSSRKSSSGPWMRAQASASFFFMPWL